MRTRKFTTMRLPSLATRMSHSPVYVGVERTQNGLRHDVRCHVTESGEVVL